jgi:hypothetical protein
MEARQNLGRNIDLTCCKAIQMNIANADRWPRTVGIELALLSSTLPDRPLVSLGRQDVNSTPRWGPGGEPPPVQEVLTFAMPASASFSYFDEFVVRFHLAGIRADKSAKIGIDRFVLVPARY